jgi:hypothetical protein
VLLSEVEQAMVKALLERVMVKVAAEQMFSPGRYSDRETQTPPERLDKLRRKTFGLHTGEL